MSYDDFSAAVRRRLEELGRSHEWLGAETARHLERARPYRQTTVTAWLNDTNRPTPEVVFAMERALQVRSGSLSRLLGYLPTSARSASGLRDVVAGDPKLSATGRRVLLAVYEELVGGGSNGS